MSSHQYQIGDIYKAADAKKIYPKEIEFAKKDVHLFLDFYRDFVGTWFDATENVDFTSPVLDDRKQTVSDWFQLADDLPKCLAENVTFAVDLNKYMAKSVTLGKLISNIKKSLEMTATTAELQGGGEIDQVYKRLLSLKKQPGFTEDTELKFNHHVVIEFDAQFSQQDKYAKLLGQGLTQASKKAKAEIKHQAEQDLIAENRAQICSHHARQIVLKRRHPRL